MKLGIIVVYLFDENTEYLLNLHLDYIRRFTDVPYTIYGSVGRLNHQSRQKLSEYPEVQQCEIPPSELRGYLEHAYYLDHLAAIAVQEGSTHVVAFHLDSFPVCLGWARKLKELTDLTGSCVVLDDYFTACLFFPKEFYLRFRPKFGGVVEAYEDADYAAFVNKYKFFNHSGTLYLYTCYINRLSWHVLKNSSGVATLKFCDIFGGMIFHLKSLITITQNPRTAKESLLGKIKLRFTKCAIAGVTFFCRHISTLAMRDWIRKNLPYSPFCLFEKWVKGQREIIIDFDFESELKSKREEMESVLEKFIENPDLYLSELQTSEVSNIQTMTLHGP